MPLAPNEVVSLVVVERSPPSLRTHDLPPPSRLDVGGFLLAPPVPHRASRIFLVTRPAEVQLDAVRAAKAAQSGGTGSWPLAC